MEGKYCIKNNNLPLSPYKKKLQRPSRQLINKRYTDKRNKKKALLAAYDVVREMDAPAFALFTQMARGHGIPPSSTTITTITTTCCYC
jgi:hypothetical protein